MDSRDAVIETGALVVEDDPAIGRAVTRALIRAGYPVLLARRCRAALELDGTFELAVLDVDLPDGSGVALAERLLDAGKIGAVVFYSATADALQLARARELGDVVSKSADLGELLDVVARVASGPVSALRARDLRAAALVRR